MNIIVIALFVLALIVFHRKIISQPIAGLWFWMVALLLRNFIGMPEINLGINIRLNDVLFVYFSLVVLVKFRQFSFYMKHDHQLRYFTYMLIFLVIAIPLFVVLKGERLVSTINFSRDFLLFAPAFLYFFSFKYSSKDVQKIANGLFILALLVAVIAFVLTLMSGERIIGASFTLFLACISFLALVSYYEKGKLKHLMLSLFLFILVIIMRHRSVWIALILGLIFTHFYIKVNANVLGIIISMFFVILVLPILFPEKYEKFSDYIAESASPFESADNFEDSTGGGRVYRWVAQIEQKFEWPILIWGLGHSYDRTVYKYTAKGERTLSTVSFHNHYLEQMFRVGAISVFVLLLFIFRFLRLNHNLQYLDKDYPLIGISAGLFGTVGFGMMYTFHYTTFILMGIGYSIIIKENEDY